MPQPTTLDAVFALLKNAAAVSFNNDLCTVSLRAEEDSPEDTAPITLHISGSNNGDYYELWERELSTVQFSKDRTFMTLEIRRNLVELVPLFPATPTPIC
jgi:hypothetical protein